MELAAAGPSEDLQPVLVVVVVRPLSLRRVAPGARNVAGGEDVLQEVKRKRLVGQRRSRERGPLGGRQLRLIAQPAGLLQRAQMKPGIHADRADLRAHLQGQHGIVAAVQPGIRTCEQEVRIVRSGARRIVGIGALQSDVSRAQRIQAPRVHGLALDATLGVFQHVGGTLRGFGPRRHRNAREIFLQLRGDVGDLQDPWRRACLLQHLAARARVVACDRAQRRPIDA
jgi:hypothetical protein